MQLYRNSGQEEGVQRAHLWQLGINRTCSPVQNFLVHLKSTTSEQSHGISYLINKNPSGASAGMRFILTQTNILQTQRAFRKTALTVISICSDSTCYNTTMSSRRLELSPEQFFCTSSVWISKEAVIVCKIRLNASSIFHEEENFF